MAGEIPSILARPAAQCAIRWGKWSILLCLLRKSGEFVRTAVRISPGKVRPADCVFPPTYPILAV
jgi:hypothetical protein